MSQTNDPRPLVGAAKDVLTWVEEADDCPDCLGVATHASGCVFGQLTRALAAEPAPVTREPDAWRWRMRHSATEPWDDWRYAPMQPLITPDAYAQVEPLFASPSAGGVTGATGYEGYADEEMLRAHAEWDANADEEIRRRAAAAEQPRTVERCDQRYWHGPKHPQVPCFRPAGHDGPHYWPGYSKHPAPPDAFAAAPEGSPAPESRGFTATEDGELLCNACTGVAGKHDSDCPLAIREAPEPRTPSERETLAAILNEYAEASHAWQDGGFRTDPPDSDEYADRILAALRTEPTNHPALLALADRLEARAKPRTPSRTWIERAAEIEDRSGSVSVGGFAADVGLYHAPLPAEPVRTPERETIPVEHLCGEVHGVLEALTIDAEEHGDNRWHAERNTLTDVCFALAALRTPAPSGEAEEARAYANQWVEAVMANYPVGWAFDPMQPRLMVDNLLRHASAPPPETRTTVSATDETIGYWHPEAPMEPDLTYHITHRVSGGTVRTWINGRELLPQGERTTTRNEGEG